MNNITHTSKQLQDYVIEDKLLLTKLTTNNVLFFSVHEDRDFIISIFIVRGNSRIPLHNHPDMHGLLQVRSKFNENLTTIDEFRYIL